VPRSTLICENGLKFFEAQLFVVHLLLEILHVSLQLHDDLVKRNLFVLKARDFPLQFCFVCFLVICNAFESVEFIVNHLSLSSNLVVLLGCIFELASDVVDVPF
jgi:hypothetical protein